MLRIGHHHTIVRPCMPFCSWAGEVWVAAGPADAPTGDMRIVLTPAQALETWQECIVRIPCHLHSHHGLMRPPWPQP